MERVKISVIILNWNGKELLQNYLPSVVKNSDYPYVKVYVADNGSTDDSLAMIEQDFPMVNVIKLERNWGFAEGYNKAIAAVESEYVVLLNSDVRVTSGWLEPLERAMDENQELAAVQPKLLADSNPAYFEYAGACGGFIDKYGYPFCRGRILNDIEEDNAQYDMCCSVFWCSGAAIMVRRELYLRVGGLDGSFFAHMEEIDLCWRMARLGYKMAAIPDSVVYHLGGGTLPMNHPAKLKLNYRNNLLMLYKNLTGKAFMRLMFVRFFMDVASLILFLFSGQFKNVKSVIEAYREFGKMRRQYSHAGKSEKVGGVYPRSIAWEYYLLKVKCFNQLRYKLSEGKFVK